MPQPTPPPTPALPPPAALAPVAAAPEALVVSGGWQIEGLPPPRVRRAGLTCQVENVPNLFVPRPAASRGGGWSKRCGMSRQSSNALFTVSHKFVDNGLKV